MSTEDSSLLLQIIAELKSLSDAIEAKRGAANTPIHQHGWNAPGLTPWDLGKMAHSLATLIESSLPIIEDEETVKILEDWPQSIKHLQKSTLPQLLNTNAPTAAVVMISTLGALQMSLNPILGWVSVRDRSKLPAALRKKLAGIEAVANELLPDVEKLQVQLKSIEDASESAYDLPVNLEELRKARAQVASDTEAVKAGLLQVESAVSKVQDSTAHLEALGREVDALVIKVRESHRITTSIGLASSFDERAKKLGFTLAVWSAVLICALCGAALLTASRWDSLTRLAEGSPNWPAVGLQVFLSTVSLAGPAWLAWIATKQISQRFKLSEDYAFKASVAKAYEGYRREAEALADTTMSSRLFNSALTRLDEAPLRFMDGENHGSPWHEFAQTRFFKEASNAVPGFAKGYSRFFSRVKSERRNETDPEVKEGAGE